MRAVGVRASVIACLSRAVAAAKAMIHRGADLPLPEANAAEIEAFAGLFATEDQREGMAAFLGKRGASFTGR